MPLLVFPYALSVLGAALYADLVFTEALAFIVIAVVLYSFEIDGVAEVTGLDPVRQSRQVSRVFSRVLYTRLVLFIAAASLLVLAIGWYRPALRELAAWWMLVPLSYALQPTWMFQGLQRNLAPAVCTFVSRATAVLLVFLLVRGPQDSMRLPQIIGISYVCGSVAMIVWARVALGLCLLRVPLAEMMSALKSGKEIFLGNMGVVLYRDSNVLLLGLIGLAGAELAAYSLAEKITKAMQAIIRPLNQLFFPRAVLAVRTVGRADRGALTALRRLTLPQLAALTVAWLGLLASALVGASWFSLRELVAEFDRIVPLAAIMSAATLFGVCNFMFGSAGLNILGERKYMLHAVLAAGGTSVVATIVLGGSFGATGAAISLVLAEGLLFGLIIRRYWRNNG
ncbi:Membrane protein involved in the export of O-antigen, teichoic acid lipoteichoic acids [plant metagenome]|uniref:Membrane protein involved in the export of O-antigen, teichoic acid lipoteichoic acids n=1 Tax=plant metagenome TaxID=1297885 RepID=A0A484VCK4_9ZZZZ